MPSDRAALKRRVSNALTAAGAMHLEPIGLARSGSSGRAWCGDRVWWQLNVWFDPSGFSVSTYLSVGPQLYWGLAGNPIMERGPGWGRQLVNRYGESASFEDDAPVEPIAEAFAVRAAEIARGIEVDLDDDWTFLDRLAVITRGRHGFIDRVGSVLLANRLLERRKACERVIAEHRRALAADPNQDQPWSRNTNDRMRLDELEQLIAADDARVLIGQRIDAGRALLGRKPMVDKPAFLLGPPRVTGTQRNPAGRRSAVTRRLRS